MPAAKLLKGCDVCAQWTGAASLVRWFYRNRTGTAGETTKGPSQCLKNEQSSGIAYTCIMYNVHVCNTVVSSTQAGHVDVDEQFSHLQGFIATLFVCATSDIVCAWLLFYNTTSIAESGLAWTSFRKLVWLHPPPGTFTRKCAECVLFP